MKPRFLIAALAVACTAHSTNVWAQAFLSDPRLTEGQGIKAGDFEFHPGVAAEGGYDSNYFQGSGTAGTATIKTPDEQVIHAYRLRITPSVSFTSRGARAREEGGGTAPTLVLHGGLSGSYNALFPAGDGHSSQLSNQDAFSGTASVGADILPKSTWGADLSADFTRFVEASNDVDVANAFRRDIIRAGAGVNWRPGGGLFSLRLGYAFKGTFFEDSNYQIDNNYIHSLVGNGQWLFLPRTALIYRGALTWLDYYEKNGPKSLGNGESMSSEVGINGLISDYFGFLGLIGWGATFYDPSAGKIQNFDSAIGQAELTWYPMPQQKLPGGESPVGLSSVSLGYTRSFGPSLLGTFYQRDRGYARMTYFFDQRFVLMLGGGLSHVTRPPSYFDTGFQQFAGGGENRVDALAFLEYRVGPTVGINATFRYDAELTNRAIQLGPDANAGFDQLEFSRYQAFLGLRWFL